MQYENDDACRKHQTKLRLRIEAAEESGDKTTADRLRSSLERDMALLAQRSRGANVLFLDEDYEHPSAGTSCR